jgi:hypothetical protein
MHRACIQDKSIQNFGRIILKQILKKCHGREWTAQDRGLCWAFLNVEVNF